MMPGIFLGLGPLMGMKDVLEREIVQAEAIGRRAMMK